MKTQRKQVVSLPPPVSVPGPNRAQKQNDVRRLDGVDPAPSSRPVDGAAWVDRAIADIAVRTARGEKVRVCFDIDDTLADTRGRSLFVAKQFDKLHGTQHFAHLTRSQVQPRGADTARAIGLPEDVVQQFTAFWTQEFWNPMNFVHDVPMKKIIDVAQRAKAAGADVTYLTGRNNGLRQGTLAELSRMGLPDADDAHLFMKPSIQSNTEAYKLSSLQSFQAAGMHLAWFMTESRRDVAFLQRDFPTLPTVLLSAAKERGGAEVRADTPVFASVLKTSRPG